MASSPIPEVTALKAPQGVHLLLSLGVPTLAAHLGVFWVTGSGPSLATTIPGLVYTLALLFWSSWRLWTHQGPVLKLWLWLVLTLALYAAVCAWSGPPWPLTFVTWGPHLVWFALAFVQGQLGALWAAQLAPRARLFQLIEGIPEGKVLEERVRDFQVDADFSRANYANLVASLAALGALSVGLASWSPHGVGALSSGLLAAFLGFCALVGVLLRTYRREMTALMYGRRFTLADKTAPLAWSAALAAAAALGAWGLTAQSGPWVDWSHLGAPGVPGAVLAMNQVPPPSQQAPVLSEGNLMWAVLLALLMQIFGFQHITWVLGSLFRLAVAAAPWVVAAFLVWPLVKWFLNGGRETRGLLGKWGALVRAQVLAFWGALAAWGRRSVSFALGTSASSGAAEWLRSFLVRPAPGRRRPYPEVIEAFLSLVRWAEPLTPYRRGETTREFLDRLAALVPGRSADLVFVRDLLDQELFGPRGLDEAGRAEFRRRVGSLTSGSASHDPTPGVS